MPEVLKVVGHKECTNVLQANLGGNIHSLYSTGCGTLGNTNCKGLAVVIYALSGFTQICPLCCEPAVHQTVQPSFNNNWTAWKCEACDQEYNAVDLIHMLNYDEYKGDYVEEDN